MIASDEISNKQVHCTLPSRKDVEKVDNFFDRFEGWLDIKAEMDQSEPPLEYTEVLKIWKKIHLCWDGVTNENK